MKKIFNEFLGFLLYHLFYVFGYLFLILFLLSWPLLVSSDKLWKRIGIKVLALFITVDIILLSLIAIELIIGFKSLLSVVACGAIGTIFLGEVIYVIVLGIVEAIHKKTSK